MTELIGLFGHCEERSDEAIPDFNHCDIVSKGRGEENLRISNAERRLGK
jgi:hypothetical protein